MLYWFHKKNCTSDLDVCIHVLPIALMLILVQMGCDFGKLGVQNAHTPESFCFTGITILQHMGLKYAKLHIWTIIKYDIDSFIWCSWQFFSHNHGGNFGMTSLFNIYWQTLIVSLAIVFLLDATVSYIFNVSSIFSIRRPSIWKSNIRQQGALLYQVSTTGCASWTKQTGP